MGRSWLFVSNADVKRERRRRRKTPTNQQNGAEPRIPKRLGLSTRVFFFSLSLYFRGSRNTARTVMAAVTPSPLSLSLLCASVTREFLLLDHWREFSFNGGTNKTVFLPKAKKEKSLLYRREVHRRASQVLSIRRLG